MTNNKAKWFVRRDSDSRILCVDGFWRNNAGSVENMKFYSSGGRAIRYGLKFCNGTATAVYPDDYVDCLGNVTRVQCTDGAGNSDCYVEGRLDRFVESDRPIRLYRSTDCEAYVGRDDTGGRYEGHTVYDELVDCVDDYDWSGLADWCDYAESSDCDDPTIY